MCFVASHIAWRVGELKALAKSSVTTTRSGPTTAPLTDLASRMKRRTVCTIFSAPPLTAQPNCVPRKRASSCAFAHVTARDAATFKMTEPSAIGRVPSSRDGPFGSGTRPDAASTRRVSGATRPLQMSIIIAWKSLAKVGLSRQSTSISYVQPSRPGAAPERLARTNL